MQVDWKMLLKACLLRMQYLKDDTERVLDLSSGDKAVLSMEVADNWIIISTDIDFNTYFSDITAKRSLSESSLALNRMMLMSVNYL